MASRSVSQGMFCPNSEILKTADGGQISLDWVDNNESSRFPDAASRPTVIFLPGLTGNSRQSYILHLVRQASRDGYRSVVFNNRGFGGEELLTPRTFCAANTDDLSVVVSHVHKQFPDAPVVAVGVSLGGMMLLNYLAAQGPSARLWAALCFSTPWNVFESTRSLEEPLNYFLFNYSLNKSLRSATEQHRRVIGRAVDVDYVLQVSPCPDRIMDAQPTSCATNPCGCFLAVPLHQGVR
ncbi:hypothetical protein XENTR_v10015304 [Xenopus tropicalis]|nr:hypothetical protein XENTR_v10015304 [Xenopus tropicalis]